MFAPQASDCGDIIHPHFQDDFSGLDRFEAALSSVLVVAHDPHAYSGDSKDTARSIDARMTHAAMRQISRYILDCGVDGLWM
jgi:hypothetical protein